jgi:hypothetical protein
LVLVIEISDVPELTKVAAVVFVLVIPCAEVKFPGLTWFVNAPMAPVVTSAASSQLLPAVIVPLLIERLLLPATADTVAVQVPLIVVNAALGIVSKTNPFGKASLKLTLVKFWAEAALLAKNIVRRDVPNGVMLTGLKALFTVIELTT